MVKGVFTLLQGVAAGMGTQPHMAGLSPAYVHTHTHSHACFACVGCLSPARGRSLRWVQRPTLACARICAPRRSVTLSAQQHAPRTLRALLHMVLLSLAYWLKAAALRTSMHVDHRTWPGRRLSSRWRRGHCRGTKTPKSSCSLVRRRSRHACSGRVLVRRRSRRACSGRDGMPAAVSAAPRAELWDGGGSRKWPKALVRP